MPWLRRLRASAATSSSSVASRPPSPHASTLLEKKLNAPARPNVPSARPSTSAHGAWATSSISASPCASVSVAQRVDGRGVAARSARRRRPSCAGVIFAVDVLGVQRRGRAGRRSPRTPAWRRSRRPPRRWPRTSSRARSPRRRARRPRPGRRGAARPCSEETATACLAPRCSANARSNSARPRAHRQPARAIDVEHRLDVVLLEAQVEDRDLREAHRIGLQPVRQRHLRPPPERLRGRRRVQARALDLPRAAGRRSVSRPSRLARPATLVSWPVDTFSTPGDR